MEFIYNNKQNIVFIYILELENKKKILNIKRCDMS